MLKKLTIMSSFDEIVENGNVKRTYEEYCAHEVQRVRKLGKRAIILYDNTGENCCVAEIV